MAKDHFAINNNNNNNNNLRVVGGILSPVSDAYGKASLIDSKHRVEMCRLACEEDDLISVDSWEASQPHWTPTLQVLNHFNDQLKQDPLCSQAKVMLLAGSDLVEGFRNETVWSPKSVQGILDYGLVIIERSAHFDPENVPCLNSQPNVYTVPQFVPCETSSSKLRLLMNSGRSIKYLTSAKVIAYIQANNLYCTM